MSQKRLFKESFLYALGNILQKLGDFVFIPIFTYYLTVEEYGNLSLYLSVIPLLLLLFQQGTRTGFLRLYYEYEGEKRERLYITVLLYNIVASGVLMLIAYVFREQFVSIISPRMLFLPTGILVLLMASTNNLFQLNVVYFQVKHKAGFYVLYSSLCFFCRYGLIIGLIVLRKMGLNGYLAGYSAANIILVFLPNLIYLAKNKFAFSTRYLLPLLTFSLPVVPHLLSTWVYNLSSRVIVEKYVSTEDYAVFSLGANIAAVFYVIVSSFALAWAPHYMKIATQSDNAAPLLKKDILAATKIFSLIFISLLLFSRELVTIAGRKPVYSSAHKIMPFILLGYFFLLMYILIVASFYLKKKTFFLSLISASTALFSIFNLLYFSKYHGINGASMAMGINYFVMFFIIAYFSNRIFPIPVGKILLLAVSINVVLTCLIAYFNRVIPVSVASTLLKLCLLCVLLYTVIGRNFITALNISKIRRFSKA